MTLRAPFEGYTGTSVGLGCIVGECCYFRRFSQFCEKRFLSSSCLSVYLSACPSIRLSAWNNSAPTGRIFTKFDIRGFVENPSRKLKLHCNLTRITGTSREDQYTFLIISRPFRLRMWNVSDESCRESQNTHFMFNASPPPA